MSNISNLTKALLKAQSQMGAATKGSKNPFFKSNYADLPTVMEVVKGPLNENGIIVLQPATFRDNKNFITTTLIHADTGETLTSDTEVVCAKQNDPQAFGAAQTYARRFGLQSMLFIPAEDDDGNYASGRSNSQGKPAAVPTTTITSYAGKAKAEVTLPTSLVEALTSSPLIGTEQTASGAEPFKKTASFSKKKKETPTTIPTVPAASQQEQSEAF